MTGTFTIEVTTNWNGRTFTEEATEVMLESEGFKYLKKGCKRLSVCNKKTRYNQSYTVYNQLGKRMAHYKF